ncbi:trimethylamine methyltransferase family protein [Desulfatitalea alkaliphila]|uniref:Trimethylamine methyltransferase family protein n=1 Tax=Desulfatitalea alkaliphila TaxID=2929485 RepID=A0AA41UJC4_9BACT|nr:trimethylamine methyltransferase family protein [Desulfatitalea alkaliphila]MCJ8500397.1 trimethylamine methyltransferase family protein [Desulfatitalea alkaliphila]
MPLPAPDMPISDPLLTMEQLAAIDAAGREILERTGLRISDPMVRRRLADSGATVDSTGETVRMPHDWLKTRLADAPRQITLCGRDPDKDLVLGGGRVHFGNGGRVFQILETATRRMRPTVLADIARAACLVDQLPHLQFFIIPCQAHDLPAAHYHLNDFFQAFNNTAKHVMGGCDTVSGARQMHALAAAIAGDAEKLRQRPFVSVITNPISPLTLDAGTLAIIDFCAGRGVPLTCAPAPMAGATAPVTLAGTLVQLHAEALGAVAVIQALHPGAPVLYGAVPSTMDLRRMNLAIGSVETAMLNGAAVALAHRHQLPIYASAGLTDAKVPDAQAGGEKMLSYLLVARAGADYIHLAAGMLDSGNAIAFEQFLIDHEMIGMIQRLRQGIDVTPATLAVEEIVATGPGGNYVLADHTVNHMMTQHFYPQHSVRMPYDLWTREGEPTLVSRSRDQVRTMLANRRDRLDAVCRNQIDKQFPEIRHIEIEENQRT